MSIWMSSGNTTASAPVDELHSDRSSVQLRRSGRAVSHILDPHDLIFGHAARELSELLRGRDMLPPIRVDGIAELQPNVLGL